MIRTLALVSVVALVAACGGESLVSDREEATQEAQGRLSGTRLRLMAGNISSGNGQSYDPGHGARIFQGLHPDIVMIQEFNYGNDSEADIRTFVDNTFGRDFAYARGAPAQIPNGVISRYPIIASGDWKDPNVANRAFTWAHIDIPGPTDLWAVSVHLLTSGASNRQSEAKTLVNYITSQVPAGDWVAIGGDFNTSSRTEAALSTFSAITTVTGPFPADRNGNQNTNAGRNKPYDWVIVSPGLASKAIPVVVGSSTFTNGLVADTRVYSPISEISPALSGDSGGPSMQHMGIVRDFDIPGGAGGGDGAGGGSGTGGSGTGGSGTGGSGTGGSGTGGSGTGGSGTGGSGTGGGPVSSIHVDAPNGGESYQAGSSQVVRWTSSNVTSVHVDFASDGVNYVRQASNVAASLGAIGWVVPSQGTTAGKIRVVSASSATLFDVSDAAFTIVAQPANVILNEILANEPGSTTAGEFIELYNAGGSAADLSGWTLSDSTSVRHKFVAGTSLAAGATIVVFAGSAGIPAGLSNAVVASTGTLSLGNSADSVTLKNASSTTVDSFSYTSTLSSNDGVSMNRSPDRSDNGTFVLHTTISTTSSSPGVAANGQP